MVAGWRESLTLPEFALPALRRPFSSMLGLILDSLIG